MFVCRVYTAEEKTRERFPDRNNRDNLDRQNHRNNGHQDRKRGLDNTVAMADKSKKFSKFKKFEDIENMHCIWHPQGNHITGDCRIFLDKYTRATTKTRKKTTIRKMRTTQGIRGLDMKIIDYYADQHPINRILAGLPTLIRPHRAFDYKLTNDQHERREDPILVHGQDTCKIAANRRAYIFMEAD
jgi:hypothetical protein